jgi:RNA polymerase sigma-70 factor (ECF subfamily)
VGDLPGVSQSESAAQFGMSKSAAKVAVHRLRKRYGQIVRQQIAETLRDPSQAEEELTHLRAALG